MLRIFSVLASFCLALPAQAASPYPAGAATADACAKLAQVVDEAATRRETVPAWSQELVDALMADADRIALLSHAIRNVPDSYRTDPLVVRAQLTLAALLLEAKQVARAREVLRGVPIDTDAAIDAGLLMAETHAIEGDIAGAVRWNLRVLQRWPDEPAAIDALVRRAAVLGESDRTAAITALNEARLRAQDAVASLGALSSRLAQDNWFSRWVEAGQEPALDSALLPLFYRTLASDAFRHARSAALATRNPAWCAREQSARLARLQQDLVRLEREARAVLAPLESRHAAEQANFDTLRARYLAGDPHDTALGQQVNRLRNAAARDAAEIAALHSTLDALPAARLRLAAEAERVGRVSAGVNEQASAEAIAALRAVVREREAVLRDIAGTASLRIGELQDPRYRKAPH